MTKKERDDMFKQMQDEILKAVVDHEVKRLADGAYFDGPKEWSGIMGIHRPAPTAEWPEFVYEDVLDADTIDG